MSSVYFNMTRQELLRLRSQKVLRVLRLEAQMYPSWRQSRDLETLRWQIKRIDAVMEAKLAQMKLL